MRGFLYGKIFSVRMTLWRALRKALRGAKGVMESVAEDAVESVAESVAGGGEGRCGAGREARIYTDILNPVILRIRDLDEILAEEA